MRGDNGLETTFPILGWTIRVVCLEVSEQFENCSAVVLPAQRLWSCTGGTGTKSQCPSNWPTNGQMPQTIVIRNTSQSLSPGQFPNRKTAEWEGWEGYRVSIMGQT